MKRKALLMLGIVAVLGATNVIGAFAAENTGEGATSTGTFTFTNDEGEGGTTPPVDPEEPEIPIDPEEPGTGNTGDLRIDYVSNFDFGSARIESGAQTFTAGLIDATKQGAPVKVPNYVQVTDLRGTGEGWQLMVEQTKAFTVVDAEHEHLMDKTLDGATIEIKNINTTTANDGNGADVPDESVTIGGENLGAKNIMSAKVDAGYGTHVAHFGKYLNQTAETASKSVELTIPANAQKVQGQYEAELTWTLLDAPGADA